MPSLKDLKVRIASVKSTQKITSAMKMVAAAKLRRAQEQAEAARPYAERMERMLGSLAGSMAGRDGAPVLLAGSGRDCASGIRVPVHSCWTAGPSDERAEIASPEVEAPAKRDISAGSVPASHDRHRAARPIAVQVRDIEGK